MHSELLYKAASGIFRGFSMLEVVRGRVFEERWLGK
jgi:hypothetical protein